MRERDYTGWLFVVFMLIALVVAVWGDKPLQKTYKNGYEVVKIGNCEYLKDVGIFHETLVHDGECKNHGDTIYMYPESVSIQVDSITQQVTAKVEYK